MDKNLNLEWDSLAIFDFENLSWGHRENYFSLGLEYLKVMSLVDQVKGREKDEQCYMGGVGSEL